MTLSTLTVATDALSPVRPVSIVDAHLHEQMHNKLQNIVRITALAEQWWSAHELWVHYHLLDNHAECEHYEQEMSDTEDALRRLGYTGIQAVNEFLQSKLAWEEADALRITVGDRA
jgi:hypothetical protein